MALFSHSRGSLLGDPFSGNSLGTHDSSEALSVSLPRHRLLLRQFLVLFSFSSFPCSGLVLFGGCHRALLEKGRTHLLAGGEALASEVWTPPCQDSLLAIN